MGAVYFYHLTERPLEATLPVLLGKALEAGWRVAVRGKDRSQMGRLDEVLWGEGFLPHGLAGGPHDSMQPVLLTTGEESNDPSCVMAIDGADVTAEEVKKLSRVCILFDGANADSLGRAREQWRELTGAGVAAQYWAEDGGRWVKKAESGA